MTQNQIENTYPQEELSRRRPKWTIMIYLAGDNNLSANSIAIMQELEAAMPPEDVRVLACFDSNTPRPRGARYLEINYRRKKNPHNVGCWGLHNDIVPLEDRKDHAIIAPDFCNPELPGPINTEPVAKEGLSRFLKFALEKHRAEKHMLILFGHGSAVAGNTFLADNNPPSFLRLKDFADVLACHFDDRPGDQKPKLDILACDNCVMNGIESAYEIRKQVDYILGSQGLMLAVGWPFRKIIKAVVNNRYKHPKRVAVAVLKACARNLIDFSLMDRSLEQSLCDLTRLRRKQNLVTAVKSLSAALQDGLQTDECGEVLYPDIRDAVRLARLEAQSFWSETFVDLYDFCELLLLRCNQALSQAYQYWKIFRSEGSKKPEKTGRSTAAKAASPREIPVMKKFEAIAEGCVAVLNEIREGKVEKFVLSPYYIGAELQYSHGVSIYFPWTLPEAPIIFEPVGDGNGNRSGGRYGISWPSHERALKAALNVQGRQEPGDYILRTAFEEYETYKFAKPEGGDWAAFLGCFFRATLRHVRRFEYEYSSNDSGDVFFDLEMIPELTPPTTPPVDLQKSGSDVDSEEDCSCPTIKNYPRRYYVSPADCLRRCDTPHRELPPHCEELNPKLPCVSYLGWNIRGLVAEVIEFNTRPEGGSECLEEDDAFEIAAEDEQAET